MTSAVRRGLALLVVLALSACATASQIAPGSGAVAATGWQPAVASFRAVGLGLGATRLAPGVRFLGGLQLIAGPSSPVHGLSDLKLVPDGLMAVTDAGDLVRWRVDFDARTGRPAAIRDLVFRRLTDPQGRPIADKTDGDAEGLAVLPDGDVLVSFERNHRIWRYDLNGSALPRAVAAPKQPFTPNDGMEGLATAPGGWRVGGEDGGVWDCGTAGCTVVVPPPTPVPSDGDFRLTGLDRDPGGDGWFAVQRAFELPLGPRARIRRMATDGSLGPVLIALGLPGTVDNFEGIAAERIGDRTRLYLLSDDNFSPNQRTLLLVFEIRSAPTP